MNARFFCGRCGEEILGHDGTPDGVAKCAVTDVPAHLRCLRVHAMNDGRRWAFVTMRKLAVRGDCRYFFRNDVMSDSMANALEDLGWLNVSPGTRGGRRRPATIELTDVGMWILGGAP